MLNAQSINTEKVLSTISSTLNEITTGLQPERLSAKEKQLILKDLDALEIQAYKCKIGLELDLFFEKNPNASSREAILHLLSTLPNTLSSELISELALYAGKQWMEKKEAVLV